MTVWSSTPAYLKKKLIPALDAFDTYINALEDETGSPATILVEQEVSFGRYIPGAFGSCDVLVRCGGRVVVLDWKFGRGVQVQAEKMRSCCSTLLLRPAHQR